MERRGERAEGSSMVAPTRNSTIQLPPSSRDAATGLR